MRFSANVGFSIIGISISITLFCLPLYAVAEHWQKIERDKQKSMRKGLDRIKATFKGDERYMIISAFYKQQHYSPIMALRSSFGLLIQIPFFIAAYSFLSHLPELQNKAFFFIKNLGTQDAMLRIGTFSINVMPILMTLINITSSMIYTKGFPLKEKLQLLIMSLIFMVILYQSPSGLVLYWTFNNIFSLGKNIFYKLKHPLFSFWICACATLIPISAKLLLFTTIKPKFKAVYIIFVIFIFIIPIVIQATKKLLNGVLSPLVRNKNSRAMLYFCSSAVLFLLLGLAIPSTLIVTSPAEFFDIGKHPNPMYYIFNTAFQTFGIFGFWAISIYFLFNAQIQTILCIIMTTLALGGICNAYIFMLNYGDLSSSLVFLSTATNFQTVSAISAVNFGIIVAIFVGTIFLYIFRHGKIISSTEIIISLSLLVISVTNITSIEKKYDKYTLSKNSEPTASIEPVFHLSKTKQNIVVFMLDCAHGGYVPEIFNEEPELNEIYSGFKYYLNAISFNGHTIQGVPGVFGGYEYTPLEMNKRISETLVEKHNEALLSMPLIFADSGFSVTITDPSFANYSDYMDLSILDPYPQINGHKMYGKYSSIWNQQNGNRSGVDNTEDILRRNLLFFSIFRASPITIREMIYMDGMYWNPNSEINRAQESIGWYSELDFLPELTDFTNDEKPTYTAIVNEFTHSNTFLQAPDYTPINHVTNFGSSKYNNDAGYHVTISAIKRIGEWLEYLKANDAYDNTRIIIVSDHGKGRKMYFDDNQELDNAVRGTLYVGRGHFHPILFFKDFGSKGNIEFDTTKFMTNADVPSLALSIGAGKVAPINPFTHKEIPLDTEKIKASGVFISANDRHVPYDHGKYKFNIKNDEWWLVKDNIFDSKNWKQINPFNNTEN